MPSRAAISFALGLLVCIATFAAYDTGPPSTEAAAPERTVDELQPRRPSTARAITWSSLVPQPEAPVVEKPPGPRTFKARRLRRRERREKATREVVAPVAGTKILEPVSTELLEPPRAWPAPAGAPLTTYERELWARGDHADPPDDDLELLRSATSMTRMIDRRTATWTVALASVDPSYRPAAEIVFTDALVAMADIESAMLDGQLDAGDAFSQLGTTNTEALAALSEVLPEQVADRIRFDLTRR